MGTPHHHADAPPPCPPRPRTAPNSTSGAGRWCAGSIRHQLLDTAVRVLLSGVFSSYADNRELQAREPAEVFDRSASDELWLDYVADLGDGWNSTYTIARLLATEELELEHDGATVHTERGRILVMGGDQVYPVPKANEYENRMLGPYRSAMPCACGDAPELFAIPGTHDWYDGAVNFTSIFCRERWIGGWRTRQRRSYFAIKLPNGWWLWGIDIQFGAAIDEVQLEYFARRRPPSSCSPAIGSCCACPRRSTAAASPTRSTPTATSSSSSARSSSPAAPSCGCTSRAASTTTRATRRSTGRASTSSPAAAARSCTRRTTSRPSAATSPRRTAPAPTAGPARIRRAEVSKRLRKRIWFVPAYNLPLAAVFGTVQVLLVFMLGLHLDDKHRDLGITDLLRAMWESPTAFLLSLLVCASLAGMVRFAHDARGIPRLLIGLFHSTLQVGSVAGMMIAASYVSSGLEGGWSLLVFMLLVWLGGIGGVVGMTAYLWATGFLGLHGTEGYAPLHHQDLKHVLRLHVQADGTLTLYPIAVDRVGRRWRLQPDAAPDAPWFAPDGPEPKAHLIEAPIRIGRSDGHAVGRPRGAPPRQVGFGFGFGRTFA